MLPRFRRPQTPISAVGLVKSTSAEKIEFNPNPGVSTMESVGMLLNSSKSLGPGSAIGKFEFVDVGKHDVESSFLKNSKYNCYRYM